MVVLGLTSSVATFANTLWIFFFPLVLRQEGLNAFEIGAVYGLSTLLGAAVRVPVGAFVDRFGRKTAVVIGTIIPVFSVMVLAFSPDSVVSASTFVFSTAVGGAFFGIGMWAMISESSKERPATSFGAFTTMAGWASVFAPVLGGMLLMKQMSEVFLFSSFLYAVAAAGRATFLEETLHKHKDTGDSIAKGQLSQSGSFRQSLRDILSNRTLILLTITCAIYNLFLDQISFVVPLYSTEVLKLSAIQVGLLFSIFLLVDSQSQVLFGRIADQFGYTRIIIVSWLGEMIFMLAFAYSADPLPSMVLFSLWVAFGAMDGPAIQALIGLTTKMESRGTSIGFFGTLASFLSVPSQFAAGLLFALSPRLPFFANLFFDAFAFLLFLLFIERVRT